MWLKALFCLVFIGCSHLAHAQPKLKVARDTYNFGRITEGSVVQHAFQIQNIGDEDLVIGRVLSSCGCTIGKSNTNTIKPGAVSTIDVKFNSAGFVGDSKKAIRLYTNDLQQPMVPLYLLGTIQPELLIEPRRVAFKGLTKEQLTQAAGNVKISVSPQASSTVKIGTVRALSKRVKVRDLGGGDKSREIQVTLSPDLTIGEFRDRILVDLVGGQSQVVNIPVSVEVVGELRLNPSVVSFGLLRENSPVSRKVIVENLSGQPVKLLSAEVNHEALAISTRKVPNSQNYEISIKLNPQLVNGEQFKGQVKLGFDLTGYSEMVLNVYGVRPPQVK
jgi:hypothetical protein